MKQSKGCIILDRDGVINYDSPDFVKTLAEWQPIPGSIEAIASLSNLGYYIGVATNQSGLARSYIKPADLQLMHEQLRQLVLAAGGELGQIAICPHLPEAECACRKPKPGLLAQIFKAYTAQCGISKSRIDQSWQAATYFVGDRKSDILAALAFGCQPVLVLTGHGLATYENFGRTWLRDQGVDVVVNLLDLAFKLQER